MPAIFLFIDGIGLAPEGENNPFFTTKTPFLSSILDGRALTREAADKEYKKASLLALDATLGVKGLPQSATGQTSLFTGVNAARILGRHLNGFPNQRLRDVLAEKGMFLQLRGSSLKGTFANAYRPDFFKDLKDGIKRNFSCTTLVTYYAGLPFRDLDDLRDGRALYMDITNAFLRSRGFDVPLVTPEEAGKVLVEISRGYDLTLFEHFMTDIAGHNRDNKKVAETIKILDAFLGSVAENMELERELLLVSSDHGNLEDLQTKVHTTNPVPALVMGKYRHELFALLRQKGDITGVFPALLEVLSRGK